MTTTKTKKHVSRRLRQFARANEAVSALEYAILVGIVAVALAVAITTFSGDVEDAIAKIGAEMKKVTVATPDADGG